MDITKHRAFISIESEFPSNRLCLTLSLGGGDTITLFMESVEQYRALRKAFPPERCVTGSREFLQGSEADAYVDDVLAALEAADMSTAREAVEAALERAEG